MAERFSHFAQSLAEQFNLPKDVVCGSILISMEGRNHVWIRNFRSLIEYSDCCIRLAGKHEKIRVSGKRLHICTYNYEELEIQGSIEGVWFE
ncbi:MAG: YabP/YqfC family sporulation protein [Lachnospiraceae bacterium]